MNTVDKYVSNCSKAFLKSFNSSFSESLSNIARSTTQTLKDSKFFARFELYGTAIVSIVDMATDVMMITLYYRGNESGFALASLVCVSLNLFFQTFAVYVLNMNLGWKVQLRELLLVWTLIKPGVDAYRVAIEAPMEAGRKIEKHEEMTLFRVVEMIFEAVPGAAIQSYAIFFSTKFRTSAGK